MPLIRLEGIATPEMRVVHNHEELIRAADAFAGPFALKANGLLHKTDSGGVALNLPDSHSLLREFDRMKMEIGAASYSIERMIDSTDGVEIIVGITRDPRFGAVLVVGLGGIHTELLRDSVLALAPVDVGRAREMLLSLKSASLLMGHRGKPSVDVESAALAIATLSRFVSAHPEWSEFEINPLLVTPLGATALDARVSV